jgi:protein SCO1/2
MTRALATTGLTGLTGLIMGTLACGAPEAGGPLAGGGAKAARDDAAHEENHTAVPETLPFYDDPYFTAEWIEPTDPRYSKLHRIGEFSLLDQTGQAFTRAELAGKIHVASFFFTTCPSVCPKMTANLMRVQDAFLDDDRVSMLSYSVASSVDTVEVLAAYAQRHGIEARRWHLLTGDRDQIYALARQSYFVEKGIGQRKANNEFIHTENVVLVDEQGRLRGIYNAMLPLDVERMIADIRILQQTG